MTPKRRWRPPTDTCAAITAHRHLSSAMCSNDDVGWPIHSLMLSFHDLRGLPMWRLPSTVPCNMIFGSISWRQTCLNHDKLRRQTRSNAFLKSIWLWKSSFWCSKCFTTKALSWKYVHSGSVIWSLLVTLPRSPGRHIRGPKLLGSGGSMVACMQNVHLHIVAYGCKKGQSSWFPVLHVRKAH